MPAGRLAVHVPVAVDPAEPLRLLAAVPELSVRRLPGSSECCGSAGLYSMLEPAMSRAVLARKVEEIAQASPRPDLVLTGNPGCLMQIGAGLRASLHSDDPAYFGGYADDNYAGGAGLRAARLPIGVAHPVELLDISYARAGFYSD